MATASGDQARRREEAFLGNEVPPRCRIIIVVVLVGSGITWLHLASLDVP